MKHYFVDTNVLFDFLLRRDTFGEDALRLFEARGHGQVTLHVSSLSFSHIYYTLRKTNSAAERLASLTLLAQLVEIIPIDRAIVEAALGLGFADFEDALQYCAARAVPAIEAIVTRDPKGFAAGVLPVLAPPAALARVGR